MKTQSRVEVMLRFLRPRLWIDVILAVIVGIISLALGLYTLEAHRTLLTRAGTAVIIFGCIVGIGGLSSRLEDATAFSLSGAGHRPELFRQIAEAGQSSLGCFFLFVAAGIGLLVIGYLLQIIPT